MALLFTTQSCNRMGAKDSSVVKAMNCNCAPNGFCSAKTNAWGISITGGYISIATDNKGLTNLYNHNKIKLCPDMGCIDIAFPDHDVVIDY